MTTYPLYPAREIISMDGLWDFSFSEDFDLQSLDIGSVRYDTCMCVPGAFDCSPAYYCKRGVGVYRRTFTVSEGCAHPLLKLGGLGLRARIWIDGCDVGSVNLPYSGVEIEFPPLSEGMHELVIAVDNRFIDDNGELFHPYYDFYAFGGLYRSVELHFIQNDFSLDRAQVITTDFSTGDVELDILFRGTVPESVEAFVCFDTDEAPRKISLDVKDNQSRVCMKVNRHKVWSPQSPDLHDVEIRVGDDRIVEQFGIREITTRGDSIYLNGEKIILKGFNRHESHPEFGPATPTQLMLEDLHNLKELNCNFIRGCHYSQDQRFLQLCDRMGFLVWEESLGWGNKQEHLGNETFCDLQLHQTRIMVRNSINHPSVIVWGFLNEFASNTDEGFALCKKLVSAIKEEDSSRLVSFACDHTHNDICSTLVDMISFNTYPGWIHTESKIEPMTEIAPEVKRCIEFFETNVGKDKPIFVSEMGTCAIYGQHDRANAQWTEEFQREYLETVLGAVVASKKICGITIWQMNDAKSCLRKGAPIRSKPLSYNLAGVFDLYRRPKLAADAVKEIFKNYK